MPTQVTRIRHPDEGPFDSHQAPPVDNKHVAPGCDLFKSRPVPEGWQFSDADRLDWMEKNWPKHGIERGSGRHSLWHGGRLLGEGKTLRDAIDAAIRETWPAN